jgi:hypothetical protein
VQRKKRPTQRERANTHPANELARRARAQNHPIFAADLLALVPQNCPPVNASCAGIFFSFSSLSVSLSDISGSFLLLSEFTKDLLQSSTEVQTTTIMSTKISATTVTQVKILGSLKAHREDEGTRAVTVKRSGYQLPRSALERCKRRRRPWWEGREWGHPNRRSMHAHKRWASSLAESDGCQGP